MNNKRKLWAELLVAALLILAFGIFSGLYMGRQSAGSQLRGMLRQVSIPNNKLTKTLSLIEHQYVDSIPMDTLAEEAIPLMLEELDPHSVYIPASEMQAVNEPLEGEFDGVGIVFNMATDTVIVLNVIPHGPSDKAGIKSGDRIIKINDSLVAGKKVPQDQIMKKLRGKRGTSVHLSLERQGIADLVDVEVERDKIPIKSVETAFVVQPGIGYLKLGQFARTTADEVHRALDSLEKQGVTKLIFDLRGNPGGFLDQAIAVADEFLHKGQLIVYTEDRAHKQLREYADGEGSAQKMQLAVLIDEESASSSEILSGALQDNDRATIIGRRSFGKGLVQQQITFDDGSALRLTIARYYTPTGRSIQKPYTKGDDADYEADLYNRYKHDELFSADSIHFADSLKFTTPGGKTVYGGGGIMPDVFVPIDTTDVTKYFMEVAGRNILYRFTIEYADRHRKALDAAKTLPQLQTLLDSDKTLMDDFVRYAAKQGVAPVPREIARSRAIIEAQLRAYIARNSPMEDAGFYINIFPIDNVVQKALEVLDKAD